MRPFLPVLICSLLAGGAVAGCKSTSPRATAAFVKGDEPEEALPEAAAARPGTARNALIPILF